MAVKLMHDVQFVKFRVNRICLRDWRVSGEYVQEVTMRILFLLIPMTALLIGAAEADAPQQVMVQAVFNENARELASPRLIVLDGKEAQIEIKREIAVPDREQPLGTSILLTIRPFLEEDCVRFSGNCRVKTEVVESERDLRLLPSRLAKPFYGHSAIWGSHIVTFEGIKMSLKFTVMAQPPVALRVSQGLDSCQNGAINGRLFFMKRNGLLAAGSWIVDQVKMVDVFPQRETLANILSQARHRRFALQRLINLAKLGAKFPMSAAGLVGNDGLGQYILDDLKRHKIDASQMRTTAKAPTSYTDVMTEVKTGRRTFFHCQGANRCGTARGWILRNRTPDISRGLSAVARRH